MGHLVPIMVKAASAIKAAAATAKAGAVAAGGAAKAGAIQGVKNAGGQLVASVKGSSVGQGVSAGLKARTANQAAAVGGVSTPSLSPGGTGVGGVSNLPKGKPKSVALESTTAFTRSLLQKGKSQPRTSQLLTSPSVQVQGSNSAPPPASRPQQATAQQQLPPIKTFGEYLAEAFDNG